MGINCCKSKKQKTKILEENFKENSEENVEAFKKQNKISDPLSQNQNGNNHLAVAKQSSTPASHEQIKNQNGNNHLAVTKQSSTPDSHEQIKNQNGNNHLAVAKQSSTPASHEQIKNQNGNNPSAVAIQSSTSASHEQIKVPRQLIKHIIGKNGYRIKKIQANSGAVISIVMLDRCDYRCKIYGNERQVTSAKKAIEKIIAGFLNQNGNNHLAVAKQSSTPASYEQIKVPRQLIKHIIGKNGYRIKKIQANSGAVISIVMLDRCHDRCKIYGNERQVTSAKKAIEEIIASFLNQNGNSYSAVAKQPTMPTTYVQIEVPLPRWLKKQIIGKKCHQIRKIEVSSGASISIITINRYPFDVICKINGTKVQVMKAKNIIEEFIADFEE